MPRPLLPPHPDHRYHKGRGALSRPAPRFGADQRSGDGDAWDLDPELSAAPGPATQVQTVQARSIISRNQSPDVPFDQSVNPYQGCEHGCIYCYARPTHAYLDLSPGLDFETRLFAKDNSAALLREELARPSYQPRVMALGANTDPYQPIERRQRLTRAVLEVLSACHHPVGITTKSALVERDIDLLAPMAARGLVRVYLSISSLDADLARTLEPRATAPRRRIETLRRLAAAGIPTGVIVAPVIPALNDDALEAVLAAAAEAGACAAHYVLLRLPLEVAPLFREWLAAHHPGRAEHVMSLIQQMRGGQDNDPRFGDRMRGRGAFADLIAQRFRLAARRHGLDAERRQLDCSQFRRPAASGQGELF